MRTVVVATLAALILSPIALSSAAVPEPGGVVLDEGKRVVLELFTSQGCSSCPAAEEVLSQIGRREETRAKVVPLAFHVDYWDEGGWHDPFSARQWTLRQEAYSRAFGGEVPYTPQLVVDGRAQFNGGDGRRALTEIAAALEGLPAVRVGVEARKGEALGSPLSVALAAAVDGSVPARKLDAYVALVESGFQTPVGSGENRGRTLRNDFVVRRLKKAFSLEPRPGGRAEGVVTLKLDDGWRPENLGVAAFLQDPKSLRIYGATAVRSVR